MRSWALVCFVLVLVPGTVSADNFDHLQGLRNTYYQHIESTEVGRSFHVYVTLPDSYGEDQRRSYPTIYILDGGTMLPLLAAYHRYLRITEEAPELILVGISYGSDTFEDGNYRSTDFTAPSAERDYWGGAKNFRNFLADELLPYVEKQYRSDARRRIVFGQSLGGQFVLFTAQTSPDLFWGHIASNPALHRNLDFFLQTQPGGDSGSRLFVASGTLDDERFRIPALKWIDHWRAHEERPWALQAVDLDGQTHVSAAPEAFRHGLHWIFSAD